MGRKIQHVPLGRISAAIDYLERTLTRDGADAFQVKPEKRKEVLASIKVRLPKATEEDKPRVFMSCANDR